MPSYADDSSTKDDSLVEDDIEVEIFHERPSQDAGYEALSSVWGPPERNKTIIVSDQVESESVTFTTLDVGPCHVPGIMFGEALLGPLPEGWSMKFLQLHGTESLVSVKEDGGKVTRQDPRMNLPWAWRYNYGSPNRPWDANPRGLKKWRGNVFKILRLVRRPVLIQD